MARNGDSCEVLEAKMRELENLKQHGVFVEAKEVTGDIIQSAWVITEKWKDGRKQTKARLVAKGFQEVGQNKMLKARQKLV